MAPQRQRHTRTAATPAYPHSRSLDCSLRTLAQVLVLLAFVAWTITQSSGGGGGGGGGSGGSDDGDENDPLVAARKIMDKYK